ncbi:uncharacterized protein LOC128928144 isoform X1 [Callithrix jacchus]
MMYCTHVGGCHREGRSWTCRHGLHDPMLGPPEASGRTKQDWASGLSSGVPPASPAPAAACWLLPQAKILPACILAASTGPAPPSHWPVEAQFMPLQYISGASSRLVLALSLDPGPPLHQPFLAQLASHKRSGQLLPPSGLSRPEASSLGPASLGPAYASQWTLQTQLVASSWPLLSPAPASVFTGPACSLLVAPSGQTGAPGGSSIPSVGLLASSPCPECLQVSLLGPRPSFRRLLRANLPFSPRSNLCGLGSSPAPGGLCRPESSGPQLRLLKTTQVMPHAGVFRLSFCPARVPIGPRCPRVGFSRPGSGLLLLASAGPTTGFSIRPLQAQLQFSWHLLPMGAKRRHMGPSRASSCLPKAPWA